MEQQFKKVSTTKVLPLEGLAEFEVALDGGYNGFVAEEKFDGSRFGVVKDLQGDIKFISTQGTDRTANVPYLVEQLEQLNIPNGTILDCEVVHLNAPFDKRWELSRGVMGTKGYNPDVAEAHLVIFDAQCINSINLMDGTVQFIDRLEVIKEIFKDKALVMDEDYPSVSIYGNLAIPELFSANVMSALFLEIYTKGGEGIMVKDLYSPKYGKSWFKVKYRFTIDAFVTGATEGKGKYEGSIGALELAVMDGDKVVPIGKCSGMSDEQRKEFTEKLPEVVEVSAFEVTKNFKLRHPAFNRVRDDKAQGECKLEQLKGILNAKRK
jgi:ATP-dependent DNA ligase